LKKLLLQGLLWRGLNYLSVFLVTIVIARLFQAGTSGLINYSINNLALLILIAGMSLESGTGYYSAKNEIPQSQLAGTSLANAIIVMAVTSISLMISGASSGLILPAILYCGGVTLMNYFTALYYSHYSYLLPNVVVVLMNMMLLGLALLVPRWLSGGDGVLFLRIYFSSFFITGVLLAVLYIMQFAGKIRLPPPQTIKKLYRYAALAMLGNLVFFLVYRVDYWFVFRYSSVEALGNYIQVSKLGQIFMLIPVIIASVIFTRAAKADSTDQIGELQKVSRILLLLYLIILATIVFIGRWLFPFVYGTTFSLMYIPFIILSPGILSLSTLTLVTAFNAGRGNLKVNLVGGSLALVVIVFGNAIFTPKYGIFSASAVSSVGYLTYQIYIMLRLKKEIPGISIHKFFIPAIADFSGVNEKN